MKSQGYDFTYTKDGMYFKAYCQNNRFKVCAKFGNKTVIAYDKDIDVASEKAKKRLKALLTGSNQRIDVRIKNLKETVMV